MCTNQRSVRMRLPNQRSASLVQTRSTTWARLVFLTLLFLDFLPTRQPSIACAQILPQSPKDLQRTAAHRMAPASFHLYPRADGRDPETEPVTVRLRIYASRDYRTQTINWQARFRQLIARVNKSTETWPGVRFEITDVRQWETDTQDQTLKDLLADLEAKDAGSDVDWVVGLAAAIPRVPESIHFLGMARVLNRHFVMRSLHDLAEYDLVRNAFDLLNPGEREQLLLERKRHKEQAVFLHEWGHTLGAIHALHPDAIMNPVYHSDASRFVEGNAQVIEWALRRRRAMGLDWRTGARAELHKLLTSIREDSWEPVELEETLRFARLQDAPEQANKKPGEDVDLLLERAEQAIASGAVADAGILLLKAHEQLGKDGSGQPRTADWARLATLYRRSRLPTLSMTASNRSDQQTSASTAAWYTAMRHRFALPADGASVGLIPTREHEYIALQERADSAISRRNPKEVQQILHALSTQFPKLPAASLVRCEWELSRGYLAEAMNNCIAVIQKDPESSSAHFLLGLIAAQRQSPHDAIVHLNRALSLDSGQPEIWKALAAALRSVRDGTAANQLSRRFHDRFGMPMQ